MQPQDRPQNTEPTSPGVRRTVTTSSSLAFVDEVADLALIFEPQTNAVVLRRRASAELSSEAARAVGDAGLNRVFTVEPGSVSTQLSVELGEAPALADDVGFLVDVLAELTGAERVGVRLARLQQAMCPRLHVDHVTLRLVTTYYGLGTQLVSSEHVDRQRLGQATPDASDEESGVLLRQSSILTASEFDVVLLKGEAWPNNQQNGAVHRSPMASTAAPRLVLTLDHL